jgi:hypothetical protein
VVILKDFGKGIGHSSRALAALPVQMSNALALGFHNAPRLYGDKTVRPAPQRITDFRSGLAAAGREFWLGLYDGVTGVVRIPYLEVHEEGLAGLPLGMAKGLGGLVLKPISGVLGLGAYPFKGAQKSLRRRVRDTEKTDRWIRRARIAQGQRDVQELRDNKQPTTPEGPHLPARQELDDIRDQALRQWTNYEKERMSEAREKEHRKMLLNRPQHAAVGRRGPGAEMQ